MTDLEPPGYISWTSIVAAWVVAAALAALSFVFLELHEPSDGAVITIRPLVSVAPGLDGGAPWRMTDAEESAMSIDFGVNYAEVPADQPELARKAGTPDASTGTAAVCRSKGLPPNPSPG